MLSFDIARNLDSLNFEHTKIDIKAFFKMHEYFYHIYKFYYFYYNLKDIGKNKLIL